MTFFYLTIRYSTGCSWMQSSSIWIVCRVTLQIFTLLQPCFILWFGFHSVPFYFLQGGSILQAH